MRNSIRLSLALLGMLALSSCAGVDPYGAEKMSGKTAVAMYSFYSEISPYNGIFKKGIQARSYFSYINARNTATGRVETIGQVSGSRYGVHSPYSVDIIPAGTYEVLSWGIGGVQTDYDADKCGHIRFTANENEIAVIKGLKPLAITGAGIFGLARETKYVSFSVLPETYAAHIRKGYPDLAASRNIRVLNLASDDPKAFTACVNSVGDRYKTLGFEKNAIPVVPKK
ncbi:MAG TPA: hypothetical protein VEF76_02990 [Patescibacteria group bacterium]|nr:hypothetical protein [Patescibacteria group bacterium]